MAPRILLESSMVTPSGMVVNHFLEIDKAVVLWAKFRLWEVIPAKSLTQLVAMVHHLNVGLIDVILVRMNADVHPLVNILDWMPLSVSKFTLLRVRSGPYLPSCLR